LDGLSFLSIDTNESNWLKEILRSMKVWEVVRDMNGDKAPGLDGFFMACFQKCWEVMKEDILKVFKEFHSRGKFEKIFNATFVSLVPKKAIVVDIKDFRPISLVGGVYKIISKVLANRLKLFWENLFLECVHRR
jgi:hypothetical protein